MQNNSITLPQANLIGFIFTAISVTLYAFGVLSAFGYQAHPTLGLHTHLGFASVFFFLGMFVSPATIMDSLPRWFNIFRSIYYYVCVLSLAICLVGAGVSFISG